VSKTTTTTTQIQADMIVRSGFRYIEYYAVGHDGYITQILNLINPKADRTKLKQPPVLMFHGSHLDSNIFLFAHSIQHHPEAWPRQPTDGPITSSNRSLAFVLANNGYDVWLMGGRGSNPPNSGWTFNAKYHQSLHPKFRPTPLMRSYSWLPWYWNYDLDDVIKNEIPVQIDLVRNITGAKEFHVLAYSISTVTTMAFLGENPDYAKRVRTYTQMAPVIAANHFTWSHILWWEKIVPYLPNRGIGFEPSYFFDDLVVRNLIKLNSYVDRLRYSLLWQWLRTNFGPTPIYQTNLERNVLYHAMQPVSFKSCQQYAQSAKYGKLRYYDYGWLGNLMRYNRTTPPEHKIDRLEVQNYLVISGSLDDLADPITVQRIKELTSTPTPPTHIIAPGFNHFDLLAGVENDRYVNLPYVEYLDQHSYVPNATSNALIKPSSAPMTGKTIMG
jgi:pimeloyl-ACP methyl ester carboxylesterase